MNNDEIYNALAQKDRIINVLAKTVKFWVEQYNSHRSKNDPHVRVLSVEDTIKEVELRIDEYEE